ncbi:MAG: hypothetical protein ACTHMS_22415 [Jatrophihabitans sp.]|uniref:hypothetical protein n=1 Tax=Jatrophihabitans sp. TaxID=1932789 RepID=UPI003F7F134A
MILTTGEVALISSGLVTLTAIVAPYLQRQTSRSLATEQANRELSARIWTERAAAYVDAIEFVVRQTSAAAKDLDELSPSNLKRISEIASTMEQLIARIVAFGSPQAFEAFGGWTETIWARTRIVRELTDAINDSSYSTRPENEREEMLELRKELRGQIEEARQRSADVVLLLGRELQRMEQPPRRRLLS